MAFGYYGLARSLYSSVIARGGEVEFEKGAMMDINLRVQAGPRHPSLGRLAIPDLRRGFAQLPLSRISGNLKSLALW